MSADSKGSQKNWSSLEHTKQPVKPVAETQPRIDLVDRPQEVPLGHRTGPDLHCGLARLEIHLGLHHSRHPFQGRLDARRSQVAPHPPCGDGDRWHRSSQAQTPPARPGWRCHLSSFIPTPVLPGSGPTGLHRRLPGLPSPPSLHGLIDHCGCRPGRPGRLRRQGRLRRTLSPVFPGLPTSMRLRTSLS